MKALPPWGGLIHFDQVMSVKFSDANKFRNILKVQNLSHQYKICLNTQ